MCEVVPMLKLLERTFPMLFVLGLVTAGLACAQDGIAALSPHPSERLSQPPAMIAVNVPGATHGTLNKGAVRLVVDGHDVTGVHDHAPIRNDIAGVVHRDDTALDGELGTVERIDLLRHGQCGIRGTEAASDGLSGAGPSPKAQLGMKTL